METLSPDLRRYLAQVSGLRGQEILTLCSISRQFNQSLCHDESFWRFLYHRDLSVLRVPDVTYREAYRRMARLLSPNDNPSIALYIAATDGYERLVKFIINSGIRPTNIAAAIAVSAQYNHPDITDYLLNLYPHLWPRARRIALNRNNNTSWHQ